MAADATQLICRSDELTEKGAGVRFELRRADGSVVKGFAIRYHGRVHAFRNACLHVPVELDLLEGQFFDISGAYLVCSMHGALYAPDSGLCVAGPCKGARLHPFDTEEKDGQVWIAEPAGGFNGY
jgi:nitrite reductase/ring-hydroxylating ferredoxin subunit